MKIFQIGAFSRLVSDWYKEFQIEPSYFRLLQIASDSDWQSEKKRFQTGSMKKSFQTVV